VKRAYPVAGWILVALFGWMQWTGWEMASGEKGVVPASARNRGGYRSFHFWTGGK
jgi:hypothetical protein